MKNLLARWLGKDNEHAELAEKYHELAATQRDQAIEYQEISTKYAVVIWEKAILKTNAEQAKNLLTSALAEMLTDELRNEGLPYWKIRQAIDLIEDNGGK